MPAVDAEGLGQETLLSPSSHSITARALLAARQFDGTASPVARSLTFQTSVAYQAVAPNGPKVQSPCHFCFVGTFRSSLGETGACFDFEGRWCHDFLPHS